MLAATPAIAQINDRRLIYLLTLNTAPRSWAALEADPWSGSQRLTQAYDGTLFLVIAAVTGWNRVQFKSGIEAGSPSGLWVVVGRPLRRIRGELDHVSKEGHVALTPDWTVNTVSAFNGLTIVAEGQMTAQTASGGYRQSDG